MMESNSPANSKTPWSSDMARQRLLRQGRPAGEFLVGAAIGAGITAQAASRGGADFLLALNAGRLRVMGLPSAASILALRENNAFVMEFARTEILTSVDKPVFFGACAFDPRSSLEELVLSIKDAGFSGIVNFPTVAWFDGKLRKWLDMNQYGFSREVEMLRFAKRQGLLTLAYVRTLDEATAMASVGVDMLNLNFGWNAGGSVGVSSPFAIEDATERARTIFRTVRQCSGETICLLEGGPILNPEQMFQVCTAANAQGYIGGSTIDRLPLEQSIEETTSAFKSAGLMKRRISTLEAQLKRFGLQYGLAGQSEAMVRVRQSIGTLAASDVPVLIRGEVGTGKSLVARALHLAGLRAQREMTVISTLGTPAEEQMRSLFGVDRSRARDGRLRLGWVEMAEGSTLLIEEISLLSKRAQGALLSLLERRAFQRLGGRDWIPAAPRILATTRLSEEHLTSALDPGLLTMFQAAHVNLPPLRERREDVPMLTSHFLEKQRPAGSGARTLAPSAWQYMLNYDWPGNVRELRSLVEGTILRRDGGTLTRRDLSEALRKKVDGVSENPVDEKEWLLQALRRNRFRRGESASELGISRKTLYNKMKKHKLP